MKASFVPSRILPSPRVWWLGIAVLAVWLALPPRAAEPTQAYRVEAVGDEPEGPARAEDLLWADAFDRAPVPAPNALHQGRFGRYVTRDASTLHYAPTEGVDGSGAIRIPWAAASGPPCVDDSRILEAAFPPTRELVVQYSVRYSPGFWFDWSRGGACTGNAKKLFLLWAAQGSRFVFIAENGSLGVGSDHDHPLFPQNRGVAVALHRFGDGRWHRVTLRIRQASSATAADGAIAGWIDGVQRWDYANLVTHNAGGYVLFKMPATFNSGSPRAQTEWVDELRIWRVADRAP